MKPSWWAARSRYDGDPGKPSPSFVRTVRNVLGPIARIFFRPTAEGFDNLPADGPFLLVANHSAGMALAEILSFAALYLDRFGDARPIAGFAHPFAFRVWPLSALLRAVGAVPSTYQHAETALAKGVPLLIFPGGDHEAARPFWRANQVDFNGRRGFLRIARKAGVPVVPMGITGSHYTAPILWRSRLLSYLLVTPALGGVKRFGLSLLGLAGIVALLFGTSWAWPLRVAAAIAWAGSPFAMWPWLPWPIRFRIGKPLPADELFGGAGQSDDDLARALERVEGQVQALVKPESIAPRAPAR